MPRWSRAELPEGFALREFPGGKYQGYSLNDPELESQIFTRRWNAVQWTWTQSGEQKPRYKPTPEELEAPAAE